MDLLLNRYKSIDFVLKLSWQRGIELYNKASREKEKEKLFSIWLSKYQHMTQKNYVSFEQFYDQCKPQKIFVAKRTTEEIIQEAREFRKSLGKEW